MIKNLSIILFSSLLILCRIAGGQQITDMASCMEQLHNANVCASWVENQQKSQSSESSGQVADQPPAAQSPQQQGSSSTRTTTISPDGTITVVNGGGSSSSGANGNGNGSGTNGDNAPKFFGDKELDASIAKIRAEYSNKEAHIPGEVDSALSACKASRDSAKSNCNIINPQALALLGVVGNIGGVAASGNSITAKCEAAGMVNTIATGANGAFGAICYRSAGSCLDEAVSGSCESLVRSSEAAMTVAQEDMTAGCGFVNDTQVTADNQALKDLFVQNKVRCERGKVEMKKEKAINLQAREMAGQCVAFQNQSYQYMLQAAASAAAIAASAACVSTASQAKSMNALVGNGNCNADPLKRQTADCICQDPAQLQTNSLCAGWRPGGAGGIGGGLSGSSGIAANKLGSDPGIEALKEMNKNFAGAGPGNGTQMKSEGVSGAGGAGGPQGGQLGALNPEENGGQPADLKTDIDQGYQRTRGGEGSMFGGGGRGGYGNSDGTSKPKSGFDLSQFLPWNKKKPVPDRQISAAGLKAEGVTGAAGPSIWEKVSGRLQKIRGRLE